MRYLLVVFAISASTVAVAQRPSSPRTPPSPPGGAPPIVMPFPPLMPPPAGGLTSGFPFTPQDPTNPPRDLFRVRPGEPSRSRPNFPVGVGYLGPYVRVPEAVGQTAPSAPANGMLRLSGTPTAALVFVDSYYVGTVGDIEDRRALELAAGPHRIEIRAPEYESVMFDVRIVSNETITYRAALTASRPSVAVRVVPAGPSRMYVIPNCYLGNMPPRAGRLPPGCNIKRVEVLGGPPA